MASWQPRALKKRGAEFVVEEDDAAVSSSKPAAATSGTAVSSSSSAQPTDDKTKLAFNGAADLEDLEEDKDASGSGAKKARTEEGAAPPASQSAKDPHRDEVADGAPRLAQHITSASKFNKVAAMAFALLEGGRVTRVNAGAFFIVLEAAMLEPRRLRDPTYRVAFRKLFSAAIARAALFPAAAQAQLKLWEMLVLVQIDLHTDDTFQFNRAAKTVRESLHGLPCVYKALEPEGAVHLAEAERGVWAPVLFECVDAAMDHHKYGWAKTTCDMLVRAIVDRRQNFTDEQQEEIQVWNAKCKGQKVVRQQEYASQRRDQSAFERKEAEWRSADIAKDKKGEPGGGGGGGLDGWCAKQSLN